MYSNQWIFWISVLSTKWFFILIVPGGLPFKLKSKMHVRIVVTVCFYFGLATNVFRLAEGGAFTHYLSFENRTSIIRKNCQPKHVTPACGKPMLVAVFLSVRSLKLFF